MTKQELRMAIQRQKEAIPESEILRRSEILISRLKQEPVYRKAAAIYGYYPINQEVRLLPLLEAALTQGKRVALPRITDSQMRFFFIRSLADTVPGYRGIREPAPFCPPAEDPTALVILPGLAFDPSGNRLGYGGGFYDRFLSREPEHPTIALCYDFQMVDAWDTDAFDRPADRVLWE